MLASEGNYLYLPGAPYPARENRGVFLPANCKGGIRRRIKSGVFYWLAVASGSVGMLYALGFAGSIEALGVISDTDFITAMVLLLLALFFARLGDHAAEREAQRRRYIDRRHARNAEPEYRQNRRDA